MFSLLFFLSSRCLCGDGQNPNIVCNSPAFDDGHFQSLNINSSTTHLIYTPSSLDLTIGCPKKENHPSLSCFLLPLPTSSMESEFLSSSLPLFSNAPSSSICPWGVHLFLFQFIIAPGTLSKVRSADSLFLSRFVSPEPISLSSLFYLS